MGKIEIRLAKESDNSEITNLSKRCLQEGIITLFINRSPKFNSLHRILDSEAWHYVACSDDRIVGLVGVIHFNARVAGTDMKVGYMLDLRLDHNYRRGTTAFRLVRAAVDHIHKSGVKLVIVNFLKDNRQPLVFTSGRAGLPQSFHMGDNNVFNILPLFKMKLNKRFTIEVPSESDIPEIVSLYRSYAGRYDIAPVITEDHFRRITSTVDGLSLNNFIVAKEDGKIKAVTAAWDEHTYKSYQVVRLNTTIKVVTKSLKFLSLFMKTPRHIRLNEPLRQLSLVYYAHDGTPEALDTLFRHVNNSHRGGNYTLIMYYAPQSDPMFRYMKKFTGVAVKSEMHLFAKDPAFYDLLKKGEKGALFDLSMLL